MAETSTLTLTDFLLARVAKDEARAHHGRWCSYIWSRETRACDCKMRRKLAECEAKRRIVEALVEAEQAVATYDDRDPKNPPSYWQEWGNHHACQYAVALLALPYADHPDYNPDWRP